MEPWTAMLPPAPRRAAFAAIAALGVAAGCAGPVAGPGTRTAGDPSAQAEPISAITGDPPNFAQFANGSLMTVVSRDFGRGAKAGALVEFYYPHMSTDHLWDAQVGVGAGGKVRWADDMTLVRQALVPDTGRAIAVFQDPNTRLTLEDVVLPGANVHLRRATFENTGTAVLADATMAFHAYFTLNGLPGGDRLRFDGQALIQDDKGVGVAVLADRPVAAGRCGLALWPAGAQRDARQAAAGGDWAGATSAGPAVGGVNGALRHDLGNLAPAGRVSVTYALAGADQGATAALVARRALNAGWDAAVAADAGRWQAHLAKTVMPGADDRVRAIYRRASIALAQHQTDDGAILAAPTNLNPPYRLVWPRDGSIIATAMATSGHAADGRRFFEFAAAKLLHADGGFAVNYWPDGRGPFWDFGTAGNEHDQSGTFAWGIREVGRGDAAWLAKMWPAAKKAGEFLMAVQEPEGLLSPCRDLWELETGGRWTYTQAAGLAGLEADAEMARWAGEPATAERFTTAAVRLRRALDAQLSPQGFFLRGLRGNKPDPRLEAANLALGAALYGVVPDSDPRMRDTGDRIATQLGTAAGGIRRYAGDRYYDGQPWPVTTAWQARHRLALGDRAGATKLFATITGYASATDALMLGEQFDEGKKRWASAFPLAWSEAEYIRLALALDRR